jgi:hypothetical protein
MRIANLTPPATHGPDLVPHISSAIGKVVRDAGVSPTEGAVVDGPAIVEADRPAIQAAINSYVHNPDFFATAEQRALRVHAALRQWEQDALAVGAQGGNVTQTQLKTLFDRFGRVCGGLADLIRHLGLN